MSSVPGERIEIKVLMITVFPPMKAPEADHALYLCEHMASSGVEMHVIAQKGCVIPSHPHITVYPVMQTWSWSEMPRLVRFVKRCGPDAVILIYIGWIYNYHPMITFAPTLVKAFRRNIPFVTLLEDAWGSCPTSLMSRVIRKGLAQWIGPSGVSYEFGTLLHESDRLIVVSDRIRSLLGKYFSGVDGKSIEIPSPPILRILPDEDGTIRERKRKELGLKDDEFLVAYFGHIYASKGVETLLQAFHKVSMQRKSLRLVLIGSTLIIDGIWDGSYSRKLYRMAKDLGIDDKMTWTGEYDWDSQLPSSYLHAADLCVLPFDWGACIHNSSLAGALAHGLPVITTKGSNTEPIFAHQTNVFLCPPKDPEALASAIETVLHNPELRQRLRAGARVLAQEYYSWEKAVERTVGALKGENTELTVSTLW